MNRTLTADKNVFGLPRLVIGHEPYALFHEGDELFDAMIASIESARQFIRFESYIFAEDEIGQRFADALVARARQGIKVQMHIDSAGSLFWTSDRLEKYLTENGVELFWFHRWSWRMPLRYNRRNHRKLLIIDESEVYLGGFNIHRENSRRLVGESRWRDTHVRLGAEYAREAAALFDVFWARKKRWKMNHAQRVSLLVPNHTHAWRRALRGLYADIIRSAEKTVYLTTPYFVPDRRLQHELCMAAKRGIDVRLLLPRKSDVWLTKWAAWAAYADLLDAGVRIYEYLPRVLHAKVAVVEGDWAIVGTANLDYRSFFLNFEINMVSRDTSLCEKLQQQFMLDLKESEEILVAHWSNRPLVRHIAELIGWIARRWL